MRRFFVLYTTFSLATAVNFAARDVDDAVGSGGVFAIDVDGDGDVDALSASYFQDTVAWYENDGSESFAGHDLTNSSGGAWSVHAIDVDGDGDVDVLSASFADDTVAWYENDGLESFVEHVVTTLADGAMTAYPIDLDGDGDVDVLYASSGDDTVAACKNDGSEITLFRYITGNAEGANTVFSIDVDGDGSADVLSTSSLDDTVAWYQTQDVKGSQTFSIVTISTLADQAASVFAIDVDNDGDVDILSASVGDDAVAWYENDGAESFAERIMTTLADGATSVFAIDVDVDGDVDALSASYFGDAVAWHENDGSESFAERVIADEHGPVRGECRGRGRVDRAAVFGSVVRREDAPKGGDRRPVRERDGGAAARDRVVAERRRRQRDRRLRDAERAADVVAEGHVPKRAARRVEDHRRGARHRERRRAPGDDHVVQRDVGGVQEIQRRRVGARAVGEGRVRHGQARLVAGVDARGDARRAAVEGAPLDDQRAVEVLVGEAAVGRVGARHGDVSDRDAGPRLEVEAAAHGRGPGADGRHADEVDRRGRVRGDVAAAAGDVADERRAGQGHDRLGRDAEDAAVGGRVVRQHGARAVEDRVLGRVDDAADLRHVAGGDGREPYARGRGHGVVEDAAERRRVVVERAAGPVEGPVEGPALQKLSFAEICHKLLTAFLHA